MIIRRQKVRRDVMTGAISDPDDLAVRYSVKRSTIIGDLAWLANLVNEEGKRALPNEIAVAKARYEANALRALNAFEESRRKKFPCKPCNGTGWIKGSRVGKSPEHSGKRVKCPKKFIAMAWENDGRVLEHRLVVARELDRCLTEEEVVHHIDQNEKNNKPKNLMLFQNDVDHQRFHNGREVDVVWSGTPGVRPIEEKDWCNDCDGSGFIEVKVPGDPRYLAEYRNSIKEWATLLGLYPKEGSKHIHLHEAPKGPIDVSGLSSDVILKARMFNDMLEQRLLENGVVVVESGYNEDEEDEDQPTEKENER